MFLCGIFLRCAALLYLTLTYTVAALPAEWQETPQIQGLVAAVYSPFHANYSLNLDPHQIDAQARYLNVRVRMPVRMPVLVRARVAYVRARAYRLRSASYATGVCFK